MIEDKKDYFLSYDSYNKTVLLYGKAIGDLGSKMVRELWNTVQSFDSKVDDTGRNLVHGSLWSVAIVKVKDTKRCPVCGHTKDYHVTADMPHGLTTGYCLHCSTNLWQDTEGNLYTTLGNKTGYYLYIDRIAGKGRPWKACHRHYAK